MSFNNTKMATGAGYLGLLGASTCCIIPFIFLVVGMGGFGASFLNSFSPYESWFLGFSLISILAGLHFAHQKGAGSSKRVKVALWIGLALIPFVYFWMDYIEPLFGVK